MPYDGSGAFQPLPAPTYPPSPGQVIRSSYFTATIDDLIGGFNSLGSGAAGSGASLVKFVGGLKSVQDLASTASGNGASLVGVQDAADYFSGANAEAILAELASPTGKFAGSGKHVFWYIPISEWQNILNRTPTIDVASYINQALVSNSSVYCPSGKYNISTLVFNYGNTLRGGGMYAPTGTEFVSTTNAPVLSFGGLPAGGSNVSFVTLSDFRVTGSRAAGTSQHGLNVYPQQSFNNFERVHIVACGGNGVNFTGTLTGAGNDQWTFRSCKIEQSLGYGFYCDTQLATSIFDQIEVYANSAGGWYFNSATYKIDNNIFRRCHTRDNGNTAGPAHGWYVGQGVQDCRWESCWCESNGERAGLVDPTHRTAGWYINTGASSTLTFDSCRNSIHAIGFWVAGNTRGVRIIDPSFLNILGWRTAADIRIDSGASAYIEDPISNGDLIIGIVDNRSVVKYNGIAAPTGANARIARGSQYVFNDGSTIKYLAGGSVTYGLYGATCSGNASTNILTATAGSSLKVGDKILIPGAGTAGAVLQAYITDMSVASLDITIDRNIITTVSAASVVTGNPLASAGAYTPTISGATTAGAGTYTTQTGSYSIDEYGYCTANVSLAWTAHTGAGTALVSFPIGCSDNAIGQVWPTNYTFGAGNFPFILATGGQSYGQLRTYSDGGAGAALALDTVASLSATVRFKITLPV